MSIVKWTPQEHLNVLASWVSAHGMGDEIGTPESYPPTGYVVNDAAIGFLYKTDAPHVGYVDGFIVAPDAPPKVRHEAIDLLVKTLVRDADESDIRLLWAFPSQKGLVAIGEGHGFTPLGDGFYGLVRVKR